MRPVYGNLTALIAAVGGLVAISFMVAVIVLFLVFLLEPDLVIAFLRGG